MIKFSLRCSNEHSFESWFRSNEAYDSLGAAGMLSCPECGCTEIRKNMMTPGLGLSFGGTPPEAPEAPASPPASATTKSPKAQALHELKKWVENNSEYVGTRFANEARAIHDGESPKRSIHGEANLAEAVELLEEGMPVLPLPWPNKQKTN